VNVSTGFAPPELEPPPLTGLMRGIADTARPDYDRLRAHALRASPCWRPESRLPD
jgi:hypothetical protein